MRQGSDVLEERWKKSTLSSGVQLPSRLERLAGMISRLRAVNDGGEKVSEEIESSVNGALKGRMDTTQVQWHELVKGSLHHQQIREFLKTANE